MTRRIQAWLSGRTSFLTKNGSLKPGDPGGSPQPAQLGPMDPQPVPPIAAGGITTMAKSPAFRVVESRTEFSPTPGYTWTDTTGTLTNPLTGPGCHCHESPSAPCVAGGS